MSILLLGLLAVVYVLINVVLPRIPLNLLLKAYVLQPLLWALPIPAVRLLPSYQPLSKNSTRNTFILLALGIAFGEIIFYFAGGLFSGFGKNSSSLTALGIGENLFLVGAMLIGMELSRAYLVNRLAERHSLIAIALPVVLFTFLGIPLLQITNFRPQIQSANTVLSPWLPLLAENMLATVLTRMAGARASLTYRGLLAAFWWFCPILPNLSWGLTSLIGVAVPIIGIVIIDRYYSQQPNLDEPLSEDGSTGMPAGWIITALVCVVMIWFAVGILPIQPELVGSGSMSPVLKTGDVVIIEKVSADTIKVGDIIEYRKNVSTNVVHRVIEIDDTAGTITFVTKGDANSTPDQNPVDADQVIGKVIFDVPKVGWVVIEIKKIFTDIEGKI